MRWPPRSSPNSNTPTMTDEEEEFLERFWIAYWQGRSLLERAFPPDGEYHPSE